MEKPDINPALTIVNELPLNIGELQGAPGATKMLCLINDSPRNSRPSSELFDVTLEEF
jgi:hypothetical protein